MGRRNSALNFGAMVAQVIAFLALGSSGAMPARADDLFKNVTLTLQPQYETATGIGTVVPPGGSSSQKAIPFVQYSQGATAYRKDPGLYLYRYVQYGFNKVLAKNVVFTTYSYTGQQFAKQSYLTAVGPRNAP